MVKEASHAHALLLTQRQHRAPVLDGIPAAFTLYQVRQAHHVCDVVQGFLQLPHRFAPSCDLALGQAVRHERICSAAYVK